MSRCGYSDDLDQRDLAMWRGHVASAIRGKRGQELLRDMRLALDAMPEKRLIRDELEEDGEVCALGAVGRYRKLDLTEVDGHDHERLGSLLNVAPCLVQEVEFINDEWGLHNSSPEQVWQSVSGWVDKMLAKRNP